MNKKYSKNKKYSTTCSSFAFYCPNVNSYFKVISCSNFPGPKNVCINNCVYAPALITPCTLNGLAGYCDATGTCVQSSVNLMPWLDCVWTRDLAWSPCCNGVQVRFGVIFLVYLFTSFIFILLESFVQLHLHEWLLNRVPDGR
jgi:hypothetical protein